MNKGFTLLEVLIYIALFSFIIGGALLTTFQILEASRNVQSKNIIDEEANFILRKLDWAVTGIETSPITATGSNLSVTKNGEVLSFDLVGGNMRLGGGVLNSENVVISNLVFDYIPVSGNMPAGISIEFEVDGRKFETIKYLR